MNAIKNIKKFKPFLINPPYKVEIEFTNPSIAYFCSFLPIINRKNSRIINFTMDDYSYAYNLIYFLAQITALPMFEF